MSATPEPTQTAEAGINWRSILVRYVRAVMDDDLTVGNRCLVPGGMCAPQWTDEEADALMAVHKEAWPEGYRDSAEDVWKRQVRGRS